MPRKEIIKSHTISVSYTFYHEARKVTTESASQIHINLLWLYCKADKRLYLQYPQNFACWQCNDCSRLRSRRLTLTQTPAILYGNPFVSISQTTLGYLVMPTHSKLKTLIVIRIKH